MKRFSLLLALLITVASAQAEGPMPTTRPGAGGTKTDLINDDQIRELYTKFAEAWNRHDVAAMASLWTIDGDQLEPDGHHAKGRDEVLKLFMREHTTVFKDTHIDLTIETVWFLAGDVALVDGTYNLTGATDPKGTPLGPRKGHLASVLLKEQGKWWVAASRLSIPVSLVWREGE